MESYHSHLNIPSQGQTNRISPAVSPRDDPNHPDHHKKHHIKMFNNPYAAKKIELTNNINISKQSVVEIFGCAIDQEDEQIAIACGDGTIRIYNLAHPSQTSAQVIKTHSQGGDSAVETAVTSVKWKKHKESQSDSMMDYSIGVDQQPLHDKSKELPNIMATATDGQFKEISVKYHKQTFTRLDAPDNQLYTLDFDKSGYTVATGGKDTFIRLYDATTKDLKQTLHSSKTLVGHSNRVQCIKFSPLKDELLYTGGWDKVINLYDIREEGPVQQINGPQIQGEAIDIRHQDGILLTGSCQPNDCIQLWDLRKTHTPLRTIDWDGGDKDASGQWINLFQEQYESHQKLLGEASAMLYTCKFDITGEFIYAAGGSGKNEFRVFNYSDGQLISCIHEFAGSIFSMDVSKRAGTNKVAFGSSDSHLRVIHVVDNKKQIQ
eukprot:403335501